MSLTKTQENDKIEVVGPHKAVQIRSATVIKEDGKELTRTYHRKTLNAGTLKGGDGSDKNDLVNTDISKEDADVQAICNSAWTDQVKSDYTAFLVANKTA